MRTWVQARASQVPACQGRGRFRAVDANASAAQTVLRPAAAAHRGSSFTTAPLSFSSLSRRSFLLSLASIMRATFLSALLYSLSTAHYSAAASDKLLKPCTAISPTTERFFDLNPLHRTPPEEGKKKKEGEEGSWHARGHDYGANFTINFCGPVVEELQNVADLDKSYWKNVSAFYEKGDKQYAIG